MASDERRTEPGTYRPEDEVDEVFARANPNPERIGCPSDDVLAALARRERPLSDPAYEHLGRCSPCYRAVRTLQQTAAAAAAARRRRVVRWLSAAAALVIAMLAAWLFVSRRGENHTPSGPELQARLDLREYETMRSVPEQPERQPLRLKRGRLLLTILLPVGFESGNYELQMLDSELRSRASATGNAEIRDYVTTLETTLDLRSLPSGNYRLALRRGGENWRFFPAQVE